MEKKNIKALFESVIDRTGENVDAALAIVRNDGVVTVIMAGVDEMMIGSNAVCMATTLRHLLETELRTADKISAKAKREGAITVSHDEPVTIKNGDGKHPEPPTNANEYGKLLAQAVSDFLDILSKHMDPPEGDD